MTAHEQYAKHRLFPGIYDYDPADNGPECEIITRILASHPWLSIKWNWYDFLNDCFGL